MTTKKISNLSVILTAAGSSTRMGGKTKKEYLPLESGTVLSTSLKKFLKATDSILYVITCPEGGIKEAEKAVFCDPEVAALLEEKPLTKVVFTEGGKTRQDSVFCALKKISETAEKEVPLFTAIHDAARPFISEELITRTLEAAVKEGAAFPGLEPVETQKQIDENGMIVSHLKRSQLISVQTPQIFRFEEILEAHRKASSDGYPYTDDTEIWGRYVGPVASVKGDSANIKITYPKDYSETSEPKERKMIRTGIGYDLHRLVEGRRLVLGGIEIPFDKGEDGHSDGDVLLHAITDSLLGASGMGDIGSYFPPEDAKWKDADSKFLLKTVWNDIKKAGWELENLDCIIKLEKPKFLPFREKVISSIAEILEVDNSQVFVKAKTYEKTGNWENQIEASAACLLSRPR